MDKPYTDLMIKAECTQWALAEKIYQKGKTDAFNQRENADGCEGCAFIDVNEWELPCAKCKRNAKDYWRPKEQK